jgi:NADPH-dependent 2,4-dienoyl-CoA reductase/sulfur reductase-like enzyme
LKTLNAEFFYFSIIVAMPLNILVAGGGLGGLGAAIALARAGHNVEVSSGIAQMS